MIPYIQELGIVVHGWYPLGGRGHTAELLGDSVISEIAVAHGKSSAHFTVTIDIQPIKEYNTIILGKTVESQRRYRACKRGVNYTLIALSEMAVLFLFRLRRNGTYPEEGG